MVVVPVRARQILEGDWAAKFPLFDARATHPN